MRRLSETKVRGKAASFQLGDGRGLWCANVMLVLLTGLRLAGLGHKGVVTIVPFAEGKGLFFVETLEEALSLHDSRSIRIKGGIRVLLRRWSPKENSEVEGRFKEGWIELRGLPFHLWSEVHLKKIMEQWGDGDRDRLVNIETF